MSDPKVDHWKQLGRITVWRHKHRHTEWNLSADRPACLALNELIGLMRDARWPSHKTIALVKPKVTATGAPIDFPATFAEIFHLKYPKDRVPEDHWELTCEEQTVELSVGQARLQELSEAIGAMGRGEGDFCIGPKDSPLWLWWYVG